MNPVPAQWTLREWDARYEGWKRDRAFGGATGLARRSGLRYGGPLGRHVADGDQRLLRLQFDNSFASLRLWNFLLTENDRLRAARRAGRVLVGAMKDLGTVPVMADALPNVTAFYPDGAWWTPCIMEMDEGLLGIADSLGIDESFCPVRATLGAFANREHFPIPDLLVCSAGATCDDFSAVAQRIEDLGFPVLWWEVPPRRPPGRRETPVRLPGGFLTSREQLAVVERQLRRVKRAIERAAGRTLGARLLERGIAAANRVRSVLDELRRCVFTAPVAPLPALEMLIAEMLAIHFCSDREESLAVLSGLLDEAKARARAGLGFGDARSARVFWVNPVADLRAMNLLEECGGRLCGTEFLFSHALDPIPTNLPPLPALARMALADPMVGSAFDRAERIRRDAQRFGAEAVVISRIPGASHCALESGVLADRLSSQAGLPVVEIEVPPLSDALWSGLRTRLQALVETVRQRRRR